VRILAVSIWPFYPFKAGPGRNAFAIAMELKKRHETKFVFAEKVKEKTFYRENGINFSIVKKTFFKNRFLPCPIRALKLVKEINSFNPEIVIAGIDSMFEAWFASRITKKKLIISTQDVLTDLGKEISKNNSFENILFKKFLCFCDGFALKHADIVTVVSEHNLKRFQELFKENKKLRVVENTVPLNCFKKALKKRLKKNSVLFVGSFLHPPNKEAFEIILKKIAPKAKNCNFYIVGRALEKITKLGWNKNVCCVGSIDETKKELESFIVSSDICIAPIISGSGIRVKILDYWAGKKPVVSTSKGAEGLKAVNGLNILIEDDLNKFHEKINQLINDKRLSKKISENGFLTLKKNYSPEIIVKKLELIFKELLFDNTKNANRIN
jgi:glycosyltransferase involved in cell wall biosynthesis